MIRTLATAALLGGFFMPASAEWRPEYAQAPQEVQDWYRNAQLTEAAQKRFPFKSCCAQADVIKAQFRASERGDEWYWLKGDTWQRIPDDIIHWGESAPGGQPTLFVIAGKEVCFWPPAGGI